MDYQEYLAHLSKLDEIENYQIAIFQDEIFNYSEQLIFTMKKDETGMKELVNIYANSVEAYSSILINTMQKTDLKHLSIKKTLLIMRHLIDALNVCITSIKVINNIASKKSKLPLEYDTLTAGIKHFDKGYDVINRFTKMLGITYNDDYTDMKFADSTLDDKPYAVDFDKILKPDD